MSAKKPFFCEHFPPFVAAALVQAGAAQDHDKIDRITDQMVARGLCRPRSDVSLFPVSAGAQALLHNYREGG